MSDVKKSHDIESLQEKCIDDKKFKTGIGPMTDNIINQCIDKITSNEVKNKLADKILEPIIDIVNEKIQPYIYLITALYIIIVILIIVNMYLVIKNR